jgi:tetratricopeptide (TPR) repeat protein
MNARPSNNPGARGSPSQRGPSDILQLFAQLEASSLSPEVAVLTRRADITAALTHFLSGEATALKRTERWEIACILGGMLASALSSKGENLVAFEIVSPLATHPKAPQSGPRGMATLIYSNLAVSLGKTKDLSGVLSQNRAGIGVHLAGPPDLHSVSFLAVGADAASSDTTSLTKARQSVELLDFALGWVNKTFVATKSDTLKLPQIRLHLRLAIAHHACEEYAFTWKHASTAEGIIDSEPSKNLDLLQLATALKLESGVRIRELDRGAQVQFVLDSEPPKRLHASPELFLQATTSHAAALAACGRSALALAKLEEAWEGILSLQEMKPEAAADSFSLKGELLLEEGSTDDAIQCFSQALELLPSKDVSRRIRAFTGLVVSTLGGDSETHNHALLSAAEELQELSVQHAPGTRSHIISSIGMSRAKSALGHPVAEVHESWEGSLSLAKRSLQNCSLTARSEILIATHLDYSSWLLGVGDDEEASKVAEQAHLLAKELPPGIQEELAEGIAKVELLRGTLAAESGETDKIKSCRDVVRRLLAHTQPWSDVHAISKELDDLATGGSHEE